jgi:voltage-gated potassium channel
MDLVVVKKYYGHLLIVASIVIISMVFMDLMDFIDIMQFPFRQVNDALIAFFAFDYFWRLYHAKDKGKFIRQNIFDLIAIVPFLTIFTFFGFEKYLSFGKVLRLVLLSRLIGVLGKLNHSAERFLKTNGFYHLISISIGLIIGRSIVSSIVEKQSYQESRWWALVTTTTVGYGDISPETAMGKIAAVILMFLGIGIIGVLTSTITNYFTEEKSELLAEEESEQSKKIDEVNEKMDVLLRKIAALEKRLEQKDEEAR